MPVTMKILDILLLLLTIIALVLILSGIFYFKDDTNTFIILGCALLSSAMGVYAYREKEKTSKN